VGADPLPRLESRRARPILARDGHAPKRLAEPRRRYMTPKAVRLPHRPSVESVGSAKHATRACDQRPTAPGSKRGVTVTTPTPGRLHQRPPIPRRNAALRASSSHPFQQEAGGSRRASRHPRTQGWLSVLPPTGAAVLPNACRTDAAFDSARGSGHRSGTASQRLQSRPGTASQLPGPAGAASEQFRCVANDRGKGANCTPATQPADAALGVDGRRRPRACVAQLRLGVQAGTGAKGSSPRVLDRRFWRCE